MTALTVVGRSCCAALAWFAVNELLVTTAVWLGFGGRWRSALTGSLRQETAVHRSACSRSARWSPRPAA